MVALLLLVLAIAVFGVGTVVEGLLWMVAIGVLLVIAAGFFGWRQISQR